MIKRSGYLVRGVGIAVAMLVSAGPAAAQTKEARGTVTSVAERSVTAFHREVRLPHLTVFADRNRVEKEETFELPGAARDRFLMEIEIAPDDTATIHRQLMFDTRFHDTDALIESVPSALFDHRDLIGGEAKRADLEILAHVRRIGRAGQRHHADLLRKSEHDLRRVHPVLRRERVQALDDVAVRREQREALVDEPVLAADRPHLGIPAGPRVAAVLDIRRAHAREVEELAQLGGGHVRDAERADRELLHRAPGLAVIASQAIALRRAVQHVAIEPRHAEVLERARVRLHDLISDRRLRVVGKPMVLPVAERELGLDEQLVARDSGASDRVADTLLEVVLALVGGVDRAKARCERGDHAVLGSVFLPGRAVDQRGRHAVIVSATVAACMSMRMRSARS